MNYTTQYGYGKGRMKQFTSDTQLQKIPILVNLQLAVVQEEKVGMLLVFILLYKSITDLFLYLTALTSLSLEEERLLQSIEVLNQRLRGRHVQRWLEASD